MLNITNKCRIQLENCLRGTLPQSNTSTFQHFFLLSLKPWHHPLFLIFTFVSTLKNQICITITSTKLKPNTSTHPNPTCWVLKQFSRRLFSLQPKMVLLLLGQIAWKNWIETVYLLVKIAIKNLKSIVSQNWTVWGSNFTAFTIFFSCYLFCLKVDEQS